ncbi:MAG: type II/IV secretion system protein [Desulfobacteraceae bacterium]|nr:MAG: type II/IV secretion system protein [Desulfobacteraceae bacterium]
MPLSSDNPLSPDQVCQVLLKTGIISQQHHEEIAKRKDQLQRKLERLAATGRTSGKTTSKGGGPVTIVDVIAAMRIARADVPDRILDEDTIFEALASAWGIPFKKIDPIKLDLNIVTGPITRSFAIKHLVVPLDIEGDNLIVAAANPFNVEVFEDIARASHKKVSAVVSPKSDILRTIEEFFGFKRSIDAAQTQFSSPMVDLGNLEQYVKVRSAEELPGNDQHIINAVNHLLSYAFDQRASDVHLEPKRDTTIVRMRIDGVLHKVYTLPKAVHSALVSRIKNLSRLNMAEKRRPQDGRIKTQRGALEVEIRVSTIPVAFGEKVVMRIMDPALLFQDLDKLGFTPADLERFEQCIDMPHGIILVCGPTGSGKSTTLYSALRRLASPEINVVTIEDPIEMVHADFNQIAIQPSIDITFGSILRNVLRQDPDVIMLGEMRDRETAENAIQAALTGHLVLSTLHTNDAASAITRLLDLGLPAFLIRASLIGVVAQRLVRTICPHCRESFTMAGGELSTLGIDLGKVPDKVTLFRGTGCPRCRGTGYLGRTAVFELLLLTESIRKLTTSKADEGAIRLKARQEGMISLRENAILKLREGVTTYQEVLRVTWENV